MARQTRTSCRAPIAFTAANAANIVSFARPRPRWQSSRRRARSVPRSRSHRREDVRLTYVETDRCRDYRVNYSHRDRPAVAPRDQPVAACVRRIGALRVKWWSLVPFRSLPLRPELSARRMTFRRYLMSRVTLLQGVPIFLIKTIEKIKKERKNQPFSDVKGKSPNASWISSRGYLPLAKLVALIKC